MAGLIARAVGNALGAWLQTQAEWTQHVRAERERQQSVLLAQPVQFIGDSLAQPAAGLAQHAAQTMWQPPRWAAFVAWTLATSLALNLARPGQDAVVGAAAAYAARVVAGDMAWLAVVALVGAGLRVRAQRRLLPYGLTWCFALCACVAAGLVPGRCGALGQAVLAVARSLFGGVAPAALAVALIIALCATAVVALAARAEVGLAQISAQPVRAHFEPLAGPALESVAGVVDEAVALPPLSLLTPAVARSRRGDYDEYAQEILRVYAQSSPPLVLEWERTINAPQVVVYAFRVATGMDVKRVLEMSESLTLALHISAELGEVRTSFVPGSNLVGVEVPKAQPDAVMLAAVMSGPA